MPGRRGAGGLVAAIGVLVAGCYAFEGEQHQIGFTSDLILGSLRPWTPDHAIAAGTRATVSPSRRVSGEGAPAVHLGEVRGLRVQENVDGSVTVRGGRRGHLSWVGEVSDGFSVRFARVDAAQFAPLWVPPPDGPGFAVVVGVDCPLTLAFEAEGETVGYRERDVSLRAGPAPLAWKEGVPVFRRDGVGAAEVDVRLGKRYFGARVIEAVPPEAVAALEVVEGPSGVTLDESTVVVAVGRLAEGRAVGCLPVTWSGGASPTDIPHVGTTEGLGATATYGRLTAHWRAGRP
jgi:hypothetical protein